MLKFTSKLIINSNLKNKSISTAAVVLSNSNENDKTKNTHTQVKGAELLRNPSLYKVR
jgi:hypothetical protein